MEQLVLATNFTDDPGGQDPVEFLRRLRRQPQLIRTLLEWERRRGDRRIDHRDGRPRGHGSWVLLYMAFVMSRETVMHRFWAKWRSSPVWELCEFDWYPSYNTLQLRFAELEERGLAEAMRLAGDELVRQARRHEPRIGADGAADATSFSAHARLRHCCPRDPATGRFTCVPAGRRSEPATLGRIDGDTVESERHSEAREPSEQPSEEITRTRAAMRPLAANSPRLQRLPRGYRYYQSGEHLYRLRDTTAGSRRYGKAEAWIGGLLLGMADVFTGAPLAMHAIPADESEAGAYPELLDRALAATDNALVRVTGDRGYSTRPVFEHNTERGIASVFPWRRINGREPVRPQADRDDYDRHGVPRCRHCGSPGDTSLARLGFHIARGNRPVIRFRCMVGLSDACAGIQEISCRTEWRLLVPLSREHESYHAMRIAGKSLERTWSAWRERYGLAGKRPETRARRRRAIPCQELRAQTARFIDWFRVLERHDFLRSARRGLRVHTINGRERLRAVRKSRLEWGLQRPYGAHAYAAGFAPTPDMPKMVEKDSAKPVDPPAVIAGSPDERPTPAPGGVPDKRPPPDPPPDTSDPDATPF